MTDKFTVCINEAEKSLTEFGADEIEQYVKRILDAAKETGLSGKAAIRAARKNVYNETLKQIGSDALRAQNTVKKFDKISSEIHEKKFTLRDFIARRTKNLGNNVESAQLANVNDLMDSVTSTLSKEDIAYLQDTDNEDEIGKAVDGANMGAEANRIGEAIRRYITHRNSKMILSDALPIDEIQSDRWIRAMHDRSRLINPSSLRERAIQTTRNAYNSIKGVSNFKEDAPGMWREFIKSRLDLGETFKNTDAFAEDGTLDDDKVDNILNEVYKNITEGKTSIFTKTGVLKDITALKKRRRMFFHWKDFSSWSDYNRQYGAGNIWGALMSDVHASANKIGMSEILGAVPEQTYEALKREQVANGIEKGAFWYHNTDNVYKWVSGQSKVAVSIKAAHLAANIRAFGSMARLGGIVGQSLTDTNIAASYAQRFGISYGESFAQQLNGIVGQYVSPELKELGEMMHLNMRHHMGYIGRFLEAQNIGNMTSKITSKYFQAVGMQAWDNGNRMGIMSTIGRRFAKNKDVSFDGLDKKLRDQLSNFNITKTEWNKMRPNIEGKFLTLDVVDKMSNDDFKIIRRDLGQDDISLDNIKNQLYRKIHTLYDVSANNAILVPGAYENSILLLGTRPGTISGELMRTIAQFKGFGLSFVNRSLVDGWKNAGDGYVKKMLFVTQLFGYMMPLSYMSTYFFNLSKGLSTPSFNDMTAAEKAQLFAAPFGVFSMGLDPNSQNSDLIGDMLFGAPASRLASSFASSVFAAGTGNFKKSKKNLTKAVQYMLPGSTFPFVQPYLKKALGEKTFVPPGQHLLYGG